MRTSSFQWQAGAYLYAESGRTGVFERDQVLCTGDEVHKCVPLLQKFAVLVPLPPHFPTPTDMSNAKDKAPVQKGQPSWVKAWIITNLI